MERAQWNKLEEISVWNPAQAFLTHFSKGSQSA